MVVTIGERGHVVEALDEERWTRFVEGHPDGTVFHLPAMHRTFAATARHRPLAVAELAPDGTVLALFTAVSIATLGGPLRSLTTRIVAFAGPLAVEGPEGTAALRRLLTAYRGRSPGGALFTEIRHIHDPAPQAATLSAAGFRNEPHLNFLVDLRPPLDELWGRVSSSAQRNVRKARRQGVEIVEADGPGETAEGYAVLLDVYHRIQVPLPDRSLFEAADRILRPAGHYRMLLARREGETIGVLTLLEANGLMTYWYTGTLREHATARAGDLLVWHAIESARERGISTMDFGGAGRPDEEYGVRDFKAKYGGDLVAYGRDVWVPSPLRLKAATAAYEAARRFL